MIKSLIVMTLLLFIFPFVASENIQRSAAKTDVQVVDLEPQELTVVLREKDSDGQWVETRQKETILAMEDFWAEFTSWNLIDMKEGEVIFEKN